VTDGESRSRNGHELLKNISHGHGRDCDRDYRDSRRSRRALAQSVGSARTIDDLKEYGGETVLSNFLGLFYKIDEFQLLSSRFKHYLIMWARQSTKCKLCRNISRKAYLSHLCCLSGSGFSDTYENTIFSDNM
jgi:hypothetical protein